MIATTAPNVPLTVGYVLKRFPRLSETFILNELLELERQGVSVRVYSLLKPPDEKRHALLSQLKAPVTYLPSSSQSSQWSVKLGYTAPKRTHLTQLLARDDASTELVLRGKSPNDICRLYHAACTVSMLARADGVQHLHAHFLSDATTVAMLAGRLSNIGFSMTAHARDIYHVYQERELDDAIRREKNHRCTLCRDSI